MWTGSTSVEQRLATRAVMVMAAESPDILTSKRLTEALAPSGVLKAPGSATYKCRRFDRIDVRQSANDARVRSPRRRPENDRCNACAPTQSVNVAIQFGQGE
jgi:hypothetical protein